jgi:hypothetical protein
MPTHVIDRAGYKLFYIIVSCSFMLDRNPQRAQI